MNLEIRKAFINSDIFETNKQITIIISGSPIFLNTNNKKIKIINDNRFTSAELFNLFNLEKIGNAKKPID